MTISAIILIGCIVAVFIAMTRQVFGPEVGMPILALCALVIADPIDSSHAVQSGFEEFGRIAIIFTAVAMAAHQLKDSNGLKSVGMVAGQIVGLASLKLALPLRIGIPAICLGMTWLLAAIFHNTTSILITAEIAFLVCSEFNVKPAPVLNGCLVASNLGGFSTRWGDTPNLIEANVWGLQASDFIQILFINLGTLILLILFVSALLRTSTLPQAEVNIVVQGFVRARKELSINAGLIIGAGISLIVVIVPAIFYPTMEFRFVGVGMLLLCLVAKLFNSRDPHINPFNALGFETLSTLAAVFILAAVLAGDHLGITGMLTSWIKTTGGATWAILGISYIGTLFTEAASWANTASTMVYSIAPSHRGAWALGAGVCAGSSSLITAASAGILLMNQTARFPEPKDRVTFSSYLRFGITFSIIMLVYYTIVISYFV